MVLASLACSSSDPIVGGKAADAGLVDGAPATADAQGLDAPPGALGARVTITGAGREQSYEWTEDNGGHLECRPDGKRYFIRLARSSANNGEDDLHVDVDICGFDGPGGYAAADPITTPCDPGQRFFDVFWHSGDGVFLNGATSSPCTLEVGGDDVRLTVVLDCADLLRPIVSPDRVAVHAEAVCERS